MEVRQGPLGRRTMGWSFVTLIQPRQRCGKCGPNGDRANSAADGAVPVLAGRGPAVLVPMQQRSLGRSSELVASLAYAGSAWCCVCRNHDEREPDDKRHQGMNRVPQHPSTCAKLGEQSQQKQTKTRANHSEAWLP